MKLGRNDPCHCGSGKKYKNCCLIAGAIGTNAPADLVWRKLRSLLERFTEPMMRFVAQTYGVEALDEAWADFAGDVEFDEDSPVLQLFTPWFYHFWSPGPETPLDDESLRGVAPTAAFLARHGSQLDPLLRRYLESCLRTPLSYYEVTGVVPGERMVLRDILSGSEHAVTERAASRSMERGDLLLAQLVHVDRLTMLEASNGFAISPMEKGRIVSLRAEIEQSESAIDAEALREYDLELIDLFHDIAERAFNPSLPTLQNTDGEPISLRKLIYDLSVPVQAAFDALKHLAHEASDEDILRDAQRDPAGELERVDFTWNRPGNKALSDWKTTVLGRIAIEPGRLTAEVNSEARADAVAKLIEAALGEGAEFRVTQVQSPEKMLAEAVASGSEALPDHDTLADLPELRAEVASMMAAHWERWVDLPLPALSGRTPLQAITDRDGREIVESLIIKAERDGRKVNPPTDPAVFRRLRERLGLPPAD